MSNKSEPFGEWYWRKDDEALTRKTLLWLFIIPAIVIGAVAVLGMLFGK